MQWYAKQLAATVLYKMGERVRARVRARVHARVRVCGLEQVASFEAVPEDNASDLSELSEVRRKAFFQYCVPHSHVLARSSFVE
jgi:hypothetical protein